MNVSSEIKRTIEKIGEAEGLKIHAMSPLAGGSINDVYCLESSIGKKVIKINESSRFPGMFEAEKQGLTTLKKIQTFDIPEAYSCGRCGRFSYLLIEFKEEAQQQPLYWEIFAGNLSKMHQYSAEDFGFPDSNYIGSLPQFNAATGSPAEFYITQRLEPQLRIALEHGFSFDNLGKVFKNISAEIPLEPPALIHGDLWSGNYITNQEGLPCLIDPAVSYGPREMDLAMMKLFGGFPKEVFQFYDEISPLAPDFERRIPLWQLYYLLVHLNIFGSSYLPSVKQILRSYS